MKNKLNLLFIGAILLAVAYSSCNANKQNGDLTMNPEAGTSYKSGQQVTVKVNFSGAKPDSVVYLIDSVKVGSKKDSTAIVLKTDTLSLGARTITAKCYQNGKNQDVSTNIVLMAGKAPEEYTYQIEKIYPHDTSSYTEGLLYQDGYLYESAGNYGHSDLRKVDLNTGKVIQRTPMLASKYFGEGISIIGEKIIQLTYREKVGFIYDKNTFKQIGTFSDTAGPEGWGMCFDGKRLYKDDSTNRIWFLDKDTYQQKGFIDVYDDKGAINMVNELEYIDGKLYSNIYTKDTILMINPKTGAVLQRINMKGLWPDKDRPANFDYSNNVLNGIAWDEKGQRLFVTGKKWPHLYQVKFVKK
jgi:glutamine cyclotransferase